jgi:release factor glutamine methyltransferase
MTIKGNTLQDLKDYFIAKLKDDYALSEINAMFYILLEDLVGITKQQFFLNPDNRVSESEIVKFIYAVKDLKAKKPIAYITQKHLFCDLPLFINNQVLIPRPETEEMVYWITEKLKNYPSPKVIDICSGSGCIALAIKKYIQQANVTGIELSSKAIEVAKANARLNQLDVEFLADDILQSVLKFQNDIDLIVSNPPYIPLHEKNTMDKSVTDYEPDLALFVPNEKPLLFYETIAQKAQLWLKNKGLLVMEIHEDYGEKTIKLLTDCNFTEVKIHKDINGKNRFVSCVKK